jgi:structural maintenance of chromosome 2
VLGDVESKIAGINAEVKALNAKKTAAKKAAEDATIAAKKLHVEIKRFGQEKGQAEKFVKNSVTKHPWITSEAEHFGVKGGEYDFEATDPIKQSSTLKSLRSEQDKLSKKINKKVMGMIEKAEGEYTDLLRKKKTIENDKKKVRAPPPPPPSSSPPPLR